MIDVLIAPGSGRTRPCPILTVRGDDLDTALGDLAPAQRAWAGAHGFKAKAGEWLPLPGDDGKIAGILFGLGEAHQSDAFAAGKLARALPEGVYRFEGPLAKDWLACLAWQLGAYAFDRYKKRDRKPARLAVAKGVDLAMVKRVAAGVYLTRDLVNTPSEDMGPAELADAARTLARSHKARVRVIDGERLAREFPMIHAVGRASTRPPRLVDLEWGPARAPRVTLVGKGVCFDTGGLDIKPASGMALMKKDMGGAAHVLGLASMIMDAALPVRLRVLVPAVDNAIAGDAFRPGDVLRSRAGISVEIDNTDAEGRLILADALALADEAAPELLVDMATLTGAARVALGPDLAPVYTDDDALAADLAEHANAHKDPVWRMPLWSGYDSWLDSKIADVNHISSNGFAGSITAALFLRRFVKQAKAYAHFDIFAWAPKEKPTCPVGGEAQGIRALYALLTARYGGG